MWRRTIHASCGQVGTLAAERQAGNRVCVPCQLIRGQRAGGALKRILAYLQVLDWAPDCVAA
jgi:hypothetical protein